MTFSAYFRRAVFLSACLLLCSSGAAQIQAVNKREIRISQNDTTEVFSVLNKDDNIKYKDNLRYYWFRADEIKSNIGASSGYVLNGHYEKFDNHYNLIEKGKFDYGLKTGLWQVWDAFGNQIIAKEYRKGVLHGLYNEYNNKGEVIRKTTYVNGKERKKVKLPLVRSLREDNNEKL